MTHSFSTLLTIASRLNEDALAADALSVKHEDETIADLGGDLRLAAGLVNDHVRLRMQLAIHAEKSGDVGIRDILAGKVAEEVGR